MDDAIDVTPEMIQAGVRVLAEDGQMSEYSAEGIVADVFKAMWAARRPVNPPPNPS
jgi:hypothetical protein